ncbi:ABC transporter ATP-binding protein [Cellulosimicrobium funkei]|nr:ABC transporter ATP-binding protein [Cellulosimicrobium funkei]
MTTADPAAPSLLLEARSLRKEFVTSRGLHRSTLVAVDDVSVGVPTASTLAVVGESGSGKSTLARMCGLLLEPTAGEVVFDGQAVTPESVQLLRREIQFVFQDPFSSLNPRHTVEQIVTAPLRYQGIRIRKDLRTFAQDMLDRVGINPDHVDRLPSQFSGGQAQRIGIARALACRPRLIICDEAVSALDVSVQAEVLQLLVDLQADYGLGYLFITHDLAVVRLIATHVAVMQSGRLVESGPADQLLDAPQERYTQELLKAVPAYPADWNI